LGEADDGEPSDSGADTQTEDVQSRAIIGDGLPDDIGEQDFKLRPGDTFPLREQTWKLDRVETSSGSDWTVVLTRVE
jgi:Family of unknown function (DUF6406)